MVVFGDSTCTDNSVTHGTVYLLYSTSFTVDCPWLLGQLVNLVGGVPSRLDDVLVPVDRLIESPHWTRDDDRNRT